MEYYIREQADGRYIVHSASGRCLIDWAKDCRSIHACYAELAEDWLMGDMSREVKITFTFANERGEVVGGGSHSTRSLPTPQQLRDAEREARRS